MSVTLSDPEAARLAVLHRYRILGASEELVFDDLTFLAAHLCQAPVAALVFLDADRLWLASHIGLYIADVQRETSFCYHLMQSGTRLVVGDLLEDERFRRHPLVARFPQMRFYAGVPLVTPDEVFLGALEVLDWQPRKLDDRQLEALQILGRQAMAQLELRRMRGDHALLLDALDTADSEASPAYDAALDGLARALDQREGYEPGHLQRLANLTLRLARRLGVAEKWHTAMRRGVLLHDIGKLALPDRILLKNGALTADEWAIMRLHPLYAYEMLRPIELLHPALDIPYCHHERWDGQGYPRGLKGEEIPLAARIFSVVDVWDALQVDRPYREGWPAGAVRDYLAKRAGADFDPRVVEALLKLV